MMKEINYDLVRYKVVRLAEDKNGKIIFTTCFAKTAGYNFTYSIGKDVVDDTIECYGIFCFKKLKQAKNFLARNPSPLCVTSLTILEVTPLTRSNRKDIKKLRYFKTHPIPEGTIRYNKINVIREVKQ